MTTEQSAPPRAPWVLTALILSALICNVNLASATIALPDIGDAFGSGQTSLNLVAIGCGLGLAMSVLYLGALADRYGRKQLLLAGLAITIVASLLAAFAPSVEFLILARVFTGVAAGMSYPTTLSLINALWSAGPRRTLAIALWSSISATSAVLGSVVAGLVLLWWWWGAALLIAVPLAIIAIPLVALVVPSHVGESDEPVDHLSGALSVLMVAALVLGLSVVFIPGMIGLGAALLVAAAVLVVLFGWRQRRAAHPLFSLSIARRRLFWAPAAGGLIVFGSLMGAMFVGPQFQQNILGYSAFAAALALVPAAVGLLVVAQFSARLVTARGSRFTMLIGYVLVLLGFITMLFWREHTPYWFMAVGYLVIGAGAGFAMTPASRSITESTPVRQVGMASATADLQRDLGGSIMQAVLGAILAGGFAAAFGRAIADTGKASEISDSITAALQASFASAMNVADKYPQYKDQILQAAQESLTVGAIGAYAVGAIAIAIGAAVIAIFVPRHSRELELIEQYAAEDRSRSA